MKKTIVIGFISFVLSFSSMGMAASVGNIANTQGGSGKFSLSIEYDRLDNRDMKFDGKGSRTIKDSSNTLFSGDFIDSGNSVKDFKSSANMLFLKGTIGIHPNIDLFLKVGTADANFKYKHVSPGSPDAKNEFNGDAGFAGGAGLKIRLFETPGGLRFMADAQYLYYEVDGEYKIDGKDLAQGYREAFIAAGARSSATASYESSVKVQEWHAALYVNQTFGIFSPYTGVKYSDLLIENNISAKGSVRFAGTPSINWSDVIKYKAKADKNLGIFLGTDIYIIPNQLSMNIEGRLLDETAGTIGLTYKY